MDKPSEKRKERYADKSVSVSDTRSIGRSSSMLKEGLLLRQRRRPATLHVRLLWP
jgi:hypothetical protein